MSKKSESENERKSTPDANHGVNQNTDSATPNLAFGEISETSPEQVPKKDFAYQGHEIADALWEALKDTIADHQTRETVVAIALNVLMTKRAEITVNPMTIAIVRSAFIGGLHGGYESNAERITKDIINGFRAIRDQSVTLTKSPLTPEITT